MIKQITDRCVDFPQIGEKMDTKIICTEEVCTAMYEALAEALNILVPTNEIERRVFVIMGMALAKARGE